MPRLFIIGGCNGAGKTTASKTILPEILECEEFINADEIAYAILPTHPELVAMRAGRIMLEQIAEHINRGIDFAFETTLSTRSYAPMLRDAKKRGYTIILIYIYLESEELAIQRVADRVARGGHSIPSEVIRRRYKRGLANFSRLFQIVADSWVLYDNSSTSPKLIARKGLGLDTDVFNADIWSSIRSLCG